MEKLVVVGENLDAVMDKRVEPLTEGGNVVGMIIHDSKLVKDVFGNIKIVKAARPSEQKTMSGFEVESEYHQDPVPKLEVRFSEPIPAPQKGQKLVDWARERFALSINTICQFTSELPKRPSDVEGIFNRETTRIALMQAIEAGHILFGCAHNLSQIDWGEGGQGEITPEKIDMFATLNWLAIIRKSLELSPVPKNTATLTEIKEGQLTFEVPLNGNGEKLTVPIQGNKIDALRITAPNDLKSKRVPTWGIAEVSKHIEGVFNTQEIKHRTYRVENGVRKLRATRFQRNVRSLFIQLHEHFGSDIFTKMVFDIDDFKFLGGDGNWSEQYDPEALPVKEHVRQVSGYVFKVLSQLCWLEKWINTEGVIGQSESKLMSFPERDEITLSVEEVIDFSLRAGLLNRIRGHLLYQLPAREITKDVFPSGSSREELIEWALGISKLGSPKTEQRDRLRIARALLTILRPSIGEPEIKRKELRTLPESLTRICFNHRGKFYLSIEDLDNLISRHVGRKELEHFNAMEFKSQGVKVIWIKGLVENEGTLRIAVNQLGEFAISGLKSGVLKGRLLSERVNWGVHEGTEKLIDLYQLYIWGGIKNYGLPAPTSVGSYILEDEIIMPDGTLEKLVPGKPIICKYDLMTGKWSLDFKALEDAIESDAGRVDVHGMHELARYLARGPKKGQRSIFCPMPTHKNVNTKAAGLTENLIFCYSGECEARVHVPARGKIRVETEYTKTTNTVKDYKPVSPERANTFEAFMQLAGVFAKNSSIAQSYIIDERGLSPADLGPYGYIPMEFNIHLENLLRSTAFKNLVTRLQHKEDYNLGSLGTALSSKLIDQSGNALASWEEVMKAINGLPEAAQEKALRSLNLISLLNMRRRVIFEPGSEEKDTPARYRLAERIIVPTYWISGRKSKPGLAQANFMGRGIVLDGQIRFRGEDHHKTILTGLKGGQTPAGFYFRDPERFLYSVTDTVVVTEAALDTASLSRIAPDLADITLTNVGLGYNELIAFLRWMGVYEDPQKGGRGLTRQIKRVILAFDFDKAGAVSFIRKSEYLVAQFPALEILPIHGFLPEEIRSISPEFNPELFKEGGKFQGFKLDLNDFLRSHDPGWEERNKVDEQRAAAIREIRRKYAYFRPS
jgi:hypothetical protein